MALIRKPKKEELELIEFLIKKAQLSTPDTWREDLKVRDMEDGKMGSINLFPESNLDDDRTFGRCVADFQFKDADDIDVIASLNVDSNEKLFELDIWKTDFSELLSYPSF